MTKTFRSDFWDMYERIESGDPLAFVRYSDGEMYMMQGQEVLLSPEITVIGERKMQGNYPMEDYKHYVPGRDEACLDLLTKAYKYQAKNYFKGLPCRCCIGDEGHEFMKKEYGEDDGHMTWSNLFINANYPLFVKAMIPMLRDKFDQVVVVCNEDADLSDTAFNVIKDFRVGKNCINNDHHLIEKIRDWFVDNNIVSGLLLSAASSLTNMIIHRLYEDWPHNTYLDIGTALHYHFKLNLHRDYLRGYWIGSGGSFANRTCIW